jgi:hypothetical protein
MPSTARPTKALTSLPMRGTLTTNPVSVRPIGQKAEKIRARQCVHTGLWRVGRGYLLSCFECKTPVASNSWRHSYWCEAHEPDWSKRQKLTAPAHKAVADAVRSKKIPPASALICVDCGKQAKCYDHRDYSKPMEIEPVCIKCNAIRGPGAPHIYLTRRKPRVAA